MFETFLNGGIAVFPVNPRPLDCFRDRLPQVGTKNDDPNSLVLDSALQSDGHCFRRSVPLSPLVLEQRGCSHLAEELPADGTRLANRIHQEIWRHCPRALEITNDVAIDSSLALFALAPKPADAGRITEKKVAGSLASHRIRCVSTGARLTIMQKPALTVASGTTPASAHITATAERARFLNRQMKDVVRRLDAQFDQIAGHGTLEKTASL